MPDLATIASYDHPEQAFLFKAKLESEGIFALVADDHMVTTNWLYSRALGGVRLRVREPDALRALAVLNDGECQVEVAPDEGEMSVEKPRCPLCGSDNAEYEEFRPRIFFLSWFVTWSIIPPGFPLPFRKRKWKCDGCGHSWKEGSGSSDDISHDVVQ
jgi:hypothetical protein